MRYLTIPDPRQKVILSPEERRILTRAIGAAYLYRHMEGWRTHTIVELPPYCVWAEDATEVLYEWPVKRWVPEYETDFHRYLTDEMMTYWRKIPDFRLDEGSVVVADEEHVVFVENYAGTRPDGKPCKGYGWELITINEYGEMTFKVAIWPSAELGENMAYATDNADVDSVVRELGEDSSGMMEKLGADNQSI